MKSPKHFLSLILLLGHMSASAMVPCTGPCDTPRPDFKCRKKVNASSVDTDTLLVRKNANVCGDLTVNGTINNLELDLLLNSNVPPTDEVYNQFYQHTMAQNILENIYDFTVPRNQVIPGTEINPDAPVYGYITTGTVQELVINGGPELSYNPDFTEVNMRYHGQNPDELIYMIPENVQAWQEHALSYYIQRGYEMPGIDVYPQYEGQFLFNNKIDFFGESTIGDFVAVKFFYEDGLVPVALDLVATAIPTIAALELYEANPALHKNGFYYPMRIPITTSFNEFNNKFNKEPYAYYDNLHRTITINVPDCTITPTQLFDYKLNISCCNCFTDIDLIDNLLSFNGTFNLMRRNAQNQLVSASFADLEYLIQASHVVSVKSELLDHGESSLWEQEYLFNEDGDVFTGLAIPLMNGAGPQTDVYCTNLGVANAFSFESDPLIFPALQEEGGASFQAGDNPLTSLVEKLGSPTYNGYYDAPNWGAIYVKLPLTVMEGQTTPEENPLVPLPELFTTPTLLLNSLIGHEMLHNTQFMQGMVPYLPTEAQATALEQDPKLNSSIYSGFRGAYWSLDYMPLVTRGLWPLTLPEINANLAVGITTYGSSIFWRYLATQFDYNNQIIRRMGDIMSHETFGPLLEENNIPYSIAAFSFGGEIGFNPAGSLLALAQSLNELYGKDVKEVFSDYAISLAMLRNNSSIPQQYRHNYPYWLASPTYAGYQEISVESPNTETWWQDYQDNIAAGTCQVSTIPAIAGAPFDACYTILGPRLTSPVLAQGEITNPPNACSTVTNNLTNKIGIVLRDGACNSATFVLNAEAAGDPIAATLIIDNGAGICNYGGSGEQTRAAVVVGQEDGELLLNALEVNPTLTIVINPIPTPFIPVLDEDIIDYQTEDMTMLILEVPEDVNTVTVDVAEGEWRISVLQFTSDGTPTGQFIIDGPHANNGGQTVLDITQFPRDPESGSVRLVCANVGIHDYQGLNNWCGAAPIYTGTISILRS